MSKNQKLTVSSWQMKSGDPGMWRRGEMGKFRRAEGCYWGQGLGVDFGRK